VDAGDFRGLRATEARDLILDAALNSASEDEDSDLDWECYEEGDTIDWDCDSPEDFEISSDSRRDLDYTVVTLLENLRNEVGDEDENDDDDDDDDED